MYVLNRQQIKSAMARKGIKGLAALARRTGLHRNTLGRFLSRHEPVLPGSVSRILDELSLSPGEALMRAPDLQGTSPEKVAADIVDKLLAAYPNAAYMLFGSRGRGAARRYSDYDIGVFSKDGLPLEKYLALLDIKEQCEDELPWFIDLVNLNNADASFLKSIAPDLRFLAGRQGDWQALKARICDEHQ